ncbi:substrate-binding periplasmic protein [Aquabacterium sp.]|uniref:substrate-binding periplasmic protein n=1 Tax=Aquabacterium sp. TaxID=1872578 RepID=UPI002E33FA66|nr:transporter substrate-binding domain-containing protein [Aquabacterium sp.]HEX5312367.1 transporter substrate-binding domain-containing protein [Aquabacterium sp.]
MAAVFAAPSFAQTRPHFIACSHNLPPHSFQASDGSPAGLASEVLLQVAKRLRWEITVNYSTWMRARVDAKSGRCDLIYTLLKKPEYEEFVVYPGTGLADRVNVLLVKKNRAIRYDGDLEGFMRRYSIGLYKDKAVSPYFDQLKKQAWARVEEPMQAESVMKMLLADRFDAAIENKATAIAELHSLGAYDQVEILSPSLWVTPSYIGFSKNGRALPWLDEFDRELKEFKASPDYKALIERYENSLAK